MEVDESVMRFLEASELLVEIADDLYDYEEDVADGAFNVYRLFIHMYGAQVWGLASAFPPHNLSSGLGRGEAARASIVSQPGR